MSLLPHPENTTFLWSCFELYRLNQIISYSLRGNIKEIKKEVTKVEVWPSLTIEPNNKWLCTHISRAKGIWSSVRTFYVCLVPVRWMVQIKQPAMFFTQCYETLHYSHAIAKRFPAIDRSGQLQVFICGKEPKNINWAWDFRWPKCVLITYLKARLTDLSKMITLN